MEQLSNNEQLARREWLVSNLAEKGEMDPEVQETLKGRTPIEE